MSTSKKKLIGITMGDPCGIGPEIILRALGNRRARAAARFIVFGDVEVLRRVADAHGIRMPRFEIVRADENIRGRRGVFMLECGRCAARLALLARATAAGGRASIDWIEGAIQHAIDGRIDGMVTAPITKEAIYKAGYDWPGHTELVAARTGVRKPVMMMVGGGLRAALVTTHAAIADLPKLITRKNVLDTLLIVNRDLRQYFGLRRPRIAVCGLNPHAGEAGKFGSEESRAIAPAVKKARARGIRCDGPTPADVVFTRHHLAKHDAIVAMYHDQATIPVKMIAFERGVNVTLGLPIIRTSPDHGTAYDIVKKGVADPGSLIEAILLAAHMAKRRRARS